ncbi:MAG: VWA domain-containing protein [Acidimicrobiia bacterium]|nr:VWA domain-containing protein [Acidimicrobiia bacterium]
MRFGAPSFLPLLVLPAALMLLWSWQLWRRRADARAFMRRRQVPVNERIPFFGELLFWFFLVLASGTAILALAKPQAVTSLVRTAGVDLVVLQDGSASMHVTDVKGNRWQRSMRLLRTLGEALRWDNDRVALALFAHMATPQIRLTKDPNTYFFFLDHLEDRSPFRLEDDGTWDTNIERGIYWGMRLIEKDEELRKTAALTAKLPEANNARAFVLISDGQSWSGEVAKSLALANGRGIPVTVVGVGTTAGGIIPDPKREQGQAAVRSVLNRAELTRIATAGGGRYYEMDRETDREIANAIIDTTRRRAGTTGIQEGMRDLYWNFLFAGGVFLVLGVLFLRDRTALALQLAAASAVLIFVQSLF